MSRILDLGAKKFDALALSLRNFSDVLVEAASLSAVQHEDDWLHACAGHHGRPMLYAAD
jgi:hypothetical protein